MVAAIVTVVEISKVGGDPDITCKLSTSDITKAFELILLLVSYIPVDIWGM